MLKELLEIRSLQDKQLKILAADDLVGFIEVMWEAVEPSTEYRHNWHIEAMADHLMACERNEIKNLIISVPPGHMKSLTVCVFFPAWCWVKKPARRFIFASYAEALSIRDSIRCRMLLESMRYKETFAPTWKLSEDQNQKKRFNNTSGGYRIATSVGGSGTGERADFVVVDDPMKATDASSELQRQNVIDWWDIEMSSRGANPADEHKIIIMQRLHQNDLAGHCEKKPGYDVLKLPAEYVPKIYSTSIGWKDPRVNDADLLWPDFYNQEKINELKKDLGSMAAEAQLQQDPKPSEGGLFKMKWWRFYKELPKSILERVQFWDCAQKPGITNDFSVCATWARTTSGYYLLDLWRGKTDGPELEMRARAQYSKHQPDAVVIEDKSAGSSLIQYLTRSTTMPVLPYNPTKDKEVRATAATPTIEAGNCFLPESVDWLHDFFKEHEQFPNSQHDDQVDTTSMMVEFFKQRDGIQPRLRSL